LDQIDPIFLEYSLKKHFNSVWFKHVKFSSHKLKERKSRQQIE